MAPASNVRGLVALGIIVLYAGQTGLDAMGGYSGRGLPWSPSSG